MQVNARAVPRSYFPVAVQPGKPFSFWCPEKQDELSDNPRRNELRNRHGGALELTARLANRFTKMVALAESNGALALQT